MYTHVCYERGNGLPSVGDEVLIADDGGWHQIMRVASTSRIQTAQWQANHVYLTLESAERDYDELSDEEQDEAFENLPHVHAYPEEE